MTVDIFISAVYVTPGTQPVKVLIKTALKIAETSSQLFFRWKWPKSLFFPLQGDGDRFRNLALTI